MELLEEILDSLPAGPAVEEAYLCAFDIAVRSVRWGLSSAFRDPCHGSSPTWVRTAGKLVGRPACEVARYALSDRLLEASLGMAAVNSLLDPGVFVLREVNAARIIEEKGRGKNVVVVGAFPFLEKIRPEVKSLRVVNRNPWEGREGVEEARAILPRADVVAITGSSFINHTAEELLALCPRAYTVILGPTTPISPVLFRYGVDAMCGAVVADPVFALPFILQGAPFRLIEGVKLVTVFKDDGGVR
jgi:uncharacterized protein (DUF4213/DUF364 family)